MYEIFDCSPRAKAKIAADFDESKAAPATPNEHHRVKYPFSALDVGKSFGVPMNEVNEGSIRNAASVHSKASGKKFCIVKHPGLMLYEVARIG